MCNKNTPPKLKSKSMVKINKQIQTTTVSLKPSRRTRTKTRKPKFLSLLRLDSSPETSQQSGEMTHHHHHQLNLFPLHPENLVEDKDLHDDNNMAYLFSTSDDTTATTLTGLLDSKTETVISSEEEDSVSPPSLTYAYGGGQDSEEAAGADGAVSLVRTALRNRERDASEEKWVCYSEVVEEKKKKVEEEVSSCFADARDYSVRTQQRHRLSLKLDYQEILNAWCDKGPLYVEGECPQTVPDLYHDHQFLPHHSGSNVLMDGLWRVPENSKIVSMEEEMNGGGGGDHGGWKIGQREASVLRYKEKRQSRLFSKRIRYQVRKVNAEKRPRMKGRFVKRS